MLKISDVHRIACLFSLGSIITTSIPSSGVTKVQLSMPIALSISFRQYYFSSSLDAAACRAAAMRAKMPSTITPTTNTPVRIGQEIIPAISSNL